MDAAKQDRAPSQCPPTDTDSISTSNLPTYHQTKQSTAYKLAKTSLQLGLLDDALSTLESALQRTLETLSEFPRNNHGELHESLAPLYYLYGTTLLYSVEESDVMMADKSGVGQEEINVGGVEQEGQGEQDREHHNENDYNNDNEELEDECPISSAQATDGDLQIAWENLETARNIVNCMISDGDFSIDANNDESPATVLKSNSKNDTDSNPEKMKYTPEQRKELLLDLAQIHTRLGDLQRANGNTFSSIEDYSRALELRVLCLGKFERLVADAHFSLASAYAEAPHHQEVHYGMENTNTGDLSKQEAMQFRKKSLDHYLACGVAFAGLIAKLCGEDAEKLTEIVGSERGSSTEVAAAATSEEDETRKTIHSKILATLRRRISELQPPPATDKNSFLDLKEMMDEIQEAMDSSEHTEQALKDVAVMKANEVKKYSSEGELDVVRMIDGGKERESSVTTTIGFGSHTAVGGVATSSASPATANAAPMMVVKKKKKPQGTEQDSVAKRAKKE